MKPRLAALAAAATFTLAALPATRADAAVNAPTRVYCERKAQTAANARAKAGSIAWWRIYEATYNACVSGVGISVPGTRVTIFGIPVVLGGF